MPPGVSGRLHRRSLRADLQVSRGRDARGFEEAVRPLTRPTADESPERRSSRRNRAVEPVRCAGRGAGQTSQHPGGVDDREHLDSSGTSGAAAVVVDGVSRSETIARVEVDQQLRAERGLDGHCNELIATVEPHDPRHRPAAEAAIGVVQDDHDLP
jgi:hypothetical protein